SGAEKAAKDYWRRNHATWTDFAMPSIVGVGLEVDFEPRDHRATVTGVYTFENHRNRSYSQIPLTAGDWDDLTWTLDGQEVEPDDRSNLFVFTPDVPLAPGDSLEIGFSYSLENPRGLSKQAGGRGEFILDSGIVLGSFGPSFVPTPGYSPSIGVDEENRFDSRDYPDDFFEGETEPLFGWGGRPFTARMSFTVPEDFTANGVGKLVSDRIEGGRRTMVWETDHPVGFFNVVAARYAVKEGNGTALYYHPAHDYNVDEMSMALDAARRYYSEWFYPFPWETLKISEFPGFATYAQGFPTNITFSEGIGFLARSDPRSHVAFMVVAHESAHQWWGNLLTPGRGPGGNMLSEGMAHYSTILLHEQVLGEQYRIEFTKRIGEQYGDQRVADTERSLVKTDDTRPGDQTVRYDKGGWVMWMLHQVMGREAMLSGLQAFIAQYNPDPDFPVIQDMLAVLRGFAPDTAAFDGFTDQWFHDVVVPEYSLLDVTRQEEGGGWIVRGTVKNVGTGLMPVEIAAAAGERFPEAPDAEETQEREDYHDALVQVTLGAGEEALFEIRSDFEPDRVVVDPDVMVLQLNRDRAEHRFGS
ncbi:MAG: M1 family aminopeptidase, partial [Gemmatimonadota bacterium]|nr:M1 family aminopeptidase [Gemmatimonadota bacterium]